MLKRIISALCIALLLASSIPLTALAEDSNIIYEGISGELILSPGSEYSPTDLFANFKNVVPGASLTQKITVRNTANNKAKVKIFLRSIGSTDEEYNDFLDQLMLTVSKVNDTPFFDAEADKTAGLTDWVCLGTLYSGGSLDLMVTLEVPSTLDNTYQKKIGKIKWQFAAEELPIVEPQWKCPLDPTHTFHIEEIDGVATFVCDKCGRFENLTCDVCGGKMHEIIYLIIDDNEYIAHLTEEKHYVTEDNRVHIYMNDEKIIDYYTVDDKTIDVRSVDEYTLYVYYECLDNEEHHTEPRPVNSGDKSHPVLWIILVLAVVIIFIILLLGKRKKRSDEDDETEAKCLNKKS